MVSTPLVMRAHPRHGIIVEGYVRKAGHAPNTATVTVTKVMADEVCMRPKHLVKKRLPPQFSGKQKFKFSGRTPVNIGEGSMWQVFKRQNADSAHHA